MAKRCRVLLMANAGDGQHRQLLRGVGLYSNSVSDWLFRSYASVNEEHLCERLIESWRPTGVISLSSTWSSPLVLARRRGIPVVQAQELDDEVDVQPAPGIHTDFRIAASMAVDYFVGRGIGSIAFAGPIRGSTMRHETYVRDEARRRGLDYSCFHGELRSEMDPDRRFRRWLGGRPKRTGLLASGDWYVWNTISECVDAGYAVPDDFAVMGVGDDSPWCELAPVPLTSISLAAEKIGYRAASMLDQMMRGEPIPTAVVVIPPTGIVTRRSTEIIAEDDPDIAAALRFIHDNAAGCTVKEVLRAVAIDRRRLERWCKQKLGRSPLDEIQRLRVANVKRLLAETDERIEEIARMAGYGGGTALCRAFQRETGTTVARYRRQFKRASSGPSPAVTADPSLP